MAFVSTNYRPSFLVTVGLNKLFVRMAFILLTLVTLAHVSHLWYGFYSFNFSHFSSL